MVGICANLTHITNKDDCADYDKSLTYMDEISVVYVPLSIIPNGENLVDPNSVVAY